MDVAPNAIAQARRKAAERGSAARFEVADVLDLGQLGLTFDTVIDSGVFHVFDDGDRARYVASLASVMRPGATCYLLCFSDRQPGDAGPRRVSQDELRAAFRDGWTVDSISAETFAISFGGRLGGAGLAGHHRAFRPAARRLVPDRAAAAMSWPGAGSLRSEATMTRPSSVPKEQRHGQGRGGHLDVPGRIRGRAP